MRRVALALLVVVGTVHAQAPEIHGRVVGVRDGDTIDVLTADNTAIGVRLCQIDAPEKSQAFGTASKQSLSALVYDQLVEIEDHGLEQRPGSGPRRTIGCVRVAGVDVQREQIQRGMAWAYTRYLTDQDLARIEANARTSRRGLWADPDPVPPWEFRRAKRHPAKTTADIEASR